MMMDKEKIFSLICQEFDEAKVFCELESLHYRPEDEDGEIMEFFWDNFVFTNNSDVRFYDAGCSKWVIAYRSLPGWVVKVPFCGYERITYDRHFDEEYDEWVEDDEPHSEYFPFEAAGNGENNWDYCLRELEVYEEAKENGLEEFFPETHFLGYYHDLPIYIAEEMDDFYCYNNNIKVSRETRATSAEISEQYKGICFSARHIALMLERGVSEEKICQLLEFLSKENISDYHSGNFGWDKNNNLRIIDFSSFEE